MDFTVASGNGIDQGTIIAMLGEVLAQVSKLDGRMGQLEFRMGQLESRVGRLEEEFGRLRSDAERGFAEIRAEIRGYHSAAVGHGIAITGLDEQVGRVSDHIGLPWQRAQ